MRCHTFGLASCFWGRLSTFYFLPPNLRVNIRKFAPSRLTSYENVSTGIAANRRQKRKRMSTKEGSDACYGLVRRLFKATDVMAYKGFNGSRLRSLQAGAEGDKSVAIRPSFWHQIMDLAFARRRSGRVGEGRFRHAVLAVGICLNYGFETAVIASCRR